MTWSNAANRSSASQKKVIAECIRQSHFGFVTAHSLCDIYYILRKDMPAEQRLKLVNMFCQFFTVIPENVSDFFAVTENPDTEDLWKTACNSNAPTG